MQGPTLTRGDLAHIVLRVVKCLPHLRLYAHKLPSVLPKVIKNLLEALYIFPVCKPTDGTKCDRHVTSYRLKRMKCGTALPVSNT